MITNPEKPLEHSIASWPPKPDIAPLGDMAVLVRFGKRLDDAANRAALAFAVRLEREAIAGVLEVVPSLVSVLVRYDPGQIGVARLSGELALRLAPPESLPQARAHRIGVRFDGPDLDEVAATLGMDAGEFVTAHNAAPLRVLTTGFAPGFVYCGFHPASLVLPRRETVRPQVEAGSVLFAAGQTAITATAIPTGWHVIGHTDFQNFDAATDPPTVLRAGEHLTFGSVS